MDKSRILKIENIFYSWVFANRFRLVILLGAVFFLLNVSHLPYLNLVFTKEVGLMLIVFICLMLFKVNSTKVFKFAIFLFLFAFLAELFKKADLVERFGDLIYIILLAGVITGLMRYGNEQKD